jgi:NAD(P)-dependent dehydrogenase (short-subunit alcohol dehydrogenase family)
VVASEVVDLGIKVNVVHPGIVRTPMYEFLATVPGEGARASIAKRMAGLRDSGQLIEPEQSARLFLWLAAVCDRSGEFIRMDDPAVRSAVDAMRPL